MPAVRGGSHPSQANDGKPSSGAPPSSSSFAAHRVNFFIGGGIAVLIQCRERMIARLQRKNRCEMCLASTGLSSCLCMFGAFILLTPLGSFYTPKNPALSALSSILCV